MWNRRHVAFGVLKSSRVSKRPVGQKAIAAAAGATLERLESRYLLSGVTFSAGVLSVVGTAGNDTIALTSDGTNVVVTMNGTASQGFDQSQITAIDIQGLAGNDMITVGPNVPAVSAQGGAGDDTIMGGSGNDTLCGGAGNDSLFGGPGDDSMRGGQGNDTLAGGVGNDSLFGGQGSNLLRGAKGDDYLAGGVGPDTMYGGPGNDMFQVPNATSDYLNGGVGTNGAQVAAGNRNSMSDVQDVVQGWLSSDMSAAVVGQSQPAIFHATLLSPPAGTIVQVHQVDASGNEIGELVQLADDGSAANQDVKAGDGIYSGSNVLNYASPGTIYYDVQVTDASSGAVFKTTSISITVAAAPSQAQVQTDTTDASNQTAVAQNVLASGGSSQAAIAAVQASLTSDTNVQPGSVQVSDTTITWKTLDGITEGVDTAELTDTLSLGVGALPSPVAPGESAPTVAVTAAAGQTMAPADATPDPTMQVLVLSPFASSLSQWDPSAAIESQFANAGYTVTYHTNQNVTFSDFTNLGQYDAIELYGHGDKLPGGGEGFYTSLASSLSTSVANIWALYNSQIVILNDYYVITPSYITAYGGQMNGTIVLANCCNSAYDDTMANAFVDDGAAAYLGYTQVVKAGFAANHAISTWTTLLQSTNNTVGDIPGINVDHDTNNPPAYFVEEDGPETATLPQGLLLKENELYVRYDWPQDQSDLDSNTTFLGTSAGYNYDGGPYLNWSGDDTSAGGQEITTVDLYDSWTAHAWSGTTTVTAASDWYTPAGGDGPAYLTIALENLDTGKFNDVFTRVMSPGQETDGAYTVQATITILLGGSDPSNPTVGFKVV